MRPTQGRPYESSRGLAEITADMIDSVEREHYTRAHRG
jgi:hypothetical protein